MRCLGVLSIWLVQAASGFSGVHTKYYVRTPKFYAAIPGNGGAAGGLIPKPEPDAASGSVQNSGGDDDMRYITAGARYASVSRRSVNQLAQQYLREPAQMGRPIVASVGL